MLIKSLNLRWLFAFFLYLGILLLIIFLANTGNLKTFPLAHPPYDKLGHFILYGIASFLSYRALNRQFIVVFKIPLPLGPFFFSLLTILEELMQSISPNRTASWLDLIASLTGIVSFYYFGEIFSKKRQPKISPTVKL